MPGTIHEQTSTREQDTTSESFLNERLTGDSIFQIFRQFSLRRDRPIIGQHLKVIVISSELAAKFPLEQLLDLMLRDNDIRPSALILVSQNKAIDVLNASQPGEVPALNLRGLVRNQTRTNRILPAVSLSKLEGLMQSERSFVLQNAIVANNELKFAGGALFNKHNNFIGQINQTDIEGISWIKGRSGGVLKTYKEGEGTTILYEITSVNSKITTTLEDGELSFHIDVNSKGELMEDWSLSKEPSSNSKYIEELEETFTKAVRAEIEQLLYKLQHTYHVDAIEFGEEVRIKYPREWNKIKERWDEVFSKTRITYDINLEIMDTGSSIE